jgi:ankyrin repeat protein
MNDDKDMIIALCEMGAHVDFRLGPKENWKTPLHIAAQQNKPKALQALLALGAWTNAVDGLSLTSLYYAATQGNRECAHRLLIARAGVEVYDENGKGPLHQVLKHAVLTTKACMNNHDQVTWLLIDFGANMNAKNVSGNTPLHVAASRSSIGCVKYLLLRGADRNATNKAKQTPIQIATLVLFHALNSSHNVTK